jgi:hypothetical protein
VILTNTGPSGVSIADFSFGIQTADTDISFTDATTGTAATYIFGPDSLFGPDLTGPASGQSLTTSDTDSVSEVTIAASSTVGLGHVLFSVAAGAVPKSFGRCRRSDYHRHFDQRHHHSLFGCARAFVSLAACFRPADWLNRAAVWRETKVLNLRRPAR